MGDEMVVIVVLVFMLNAVVGTVVVLVLTLAGVEEMFLVMAMLITM